MSIKSDNESMAKLYTEGTMSAEDKKKAAEVKKMYSADEPMGQAAGLKLKAAANDLDRKYGKDWRKEEDAEGGVVYVVETDAEYEDTQRHGIFTDFETAKKHAAEVELLPGFWVGITEVPLNEPEAQGKYHRLS